MIAAETPVVKREVAARAGSVPVGRDDLRVIRAPAGKSGERDTDSGDVVAGADVACRGRGSVFRRPAVSDDDLRVRQVRIDPGTDRGRRRSG
jgi:hypothetical protein